MGIEYHIACSPDRLPRFAEFLLRAGGQPHPQTPEQFEFFFGPVVPGSMPDVTAVVEPAHLSFDHGGSREAVAVLFRRLVDEALALSDNSDTITITGL